MTAEEFIHEWKDNPDYIPVQTSGSTGSPQRLLLKKTDMIASARATNAFFGLRKGARFVCPMDFRFIGAKMMAVRSIVAEGKLVDITPSNNFDFEGTADLLAVTPSQVDCIIRNHSMHNRIRNLIIGGAPLSEKRIEQLLEIGINAYTTYGMTETASHVALSRIGENLYHALPGISFETDDESCLIIKLDGRSETEVRTNDIVKIVDPQSFEWLGRRDFIINSGGLKIVPEQVEAAVRLALNKVGIAFSNILVVPRKSEKWGTEAVALIETMDTSQSFEDGSLKDLIKHYLRKLNIDAKHCPKDFYSVSNLPCTENGKLDRRAATKLFYQK